MKFAQLLIALGLLGLAAAAANDRALLQTQSPVAAAAEALVAIATATGTTTTYPIGGKEGKDFPRLVGPTFKFAYKDGIGAFQGWNGGLELPKVIDLGGVRSTRPGLRGRKLAQTQSPVAAAAEALVAIATATGTTTTYPIGGKEGKDFPRLVGPTFKFAYKDGIGAFQGWNGGLELPKVIDLGGVRSTRPGLRGKKMH